MAQLILAGLGRQAGLSRLWVGFMSALCIFILIPRQTGSSWLGHALLWWTADAQEPTGSLRCSERLPLELEGVTSVLILSAKASHIAKPHTDEAEREHVCIF